MANPYHDAEGKFCSRGEMSAAVEAAQKAGDFETYFRLRTDFEAAESDPKNTFKNGPSEAAPIPANKVRLKLEAYMKQRQVEERYFDFSDLEFDEGSKVKVKGLGEVEYISEGGGGIGETNTIIVYVKVADHYYSLNGYYSSQDGSDWNYFSVHRVEPKNVSVTQFIPTED